jgi:hypothetical protein
MMIKQREESRGVESGSGGGRGEEVRRISEARVNACITSIGESWRRRSVGQVKNAIAPINTRIVKTMKGSWEGMGLSVGDMLLFVDGRTQAKCTRASC